MRPERLGDSSEGWGVPPAIAIAPPKSCTAFPARPRGCFGPGRGERQAELLWNSRQIGPRGGAAVNQHLTTPPAAGLICVRDALGYVTPERRRVRDYMFNNLFGDGRIGGILALVIGLCLLGLIAIYLWRAFGRGIRAAAPRGARQPRLGIVDAFDLDRHRQLVLVRRDNVEHLIMIGGPNDLLIEEAIVRAQPSGVERREPVGAPNNQAERQPPRLPIEPSQGGQGASTAPSLDIKPGQQEPAAAPVAPQLRPTIDPVQAETPVAPRAPPN